MNLLYANDQPGTYPNSWYAATAPALPPFPALKGDVNCDVCVIGAGFTGLSAALHLAQSGRSVVVLEAHRVGFGASGRNGGQVGTGQRKDQDELERQLGRDDAKKLWDIAEAAKDLVKSLISTHGIDAAWKDGVAHADWSAKGAKETQEYARWLCDSYDCPHIEPLSRAQIRDLIGSEAFHGGMIDKSAGHIHPLRFALGLAIAADGAGVRIFENSPAHSVSGGTVTTPNGKVIADQVIFATNGYHDGLNRKIAARVLPINNFIVATEPLGDRTTTVLSQDIAVADSKFVVNYWRLSEDRRLIFGGCESYGDRFPSDIAQMVRKPMLEIYPQLADARIDYAWGGTLAITPSRMPDFARLNAQHWSAAGYSGHGVALATMAGRILSDAINGDIGDLELMGKVRPPAFPGIGLLRRPILNLAMRWYALRDRIG